MQKKEIKILLYLNMKKDKKNRNYFDNYTKKVFENIVGGLVFSIILFIIYLIYEAVK